MDSAEQRAPTRISFEKQEEDGWPKRIRETVKQKYNDYSLGLTQEQVQRLRNTPIGKKQMDYHDKNEELVSTGEIVRFPGGGIFMAILTDGIEDIWGLKQAAKIVSKFADDMAVFREHYPPGPPKHEDKRFKKSYERDLARCTPLGYQVGVHYIGMRRQGRRKSATNPKYDERNHFGWKGFGRIDIAYLGFIVPTNVEQSMMRGGLGGWK